MGANDEAIPTVPPAMPGEAVAAVAPDEAISELEATTPPATLDYAHGESGDRRFRVGTLVYTSGGIIVLFCWLLFGDFALSTRDRSVSPTVQLFLRSLNASGFTMTMLLTFLPPAIGLVLSPMVSYRSDRLRSRWGRRIPFLLIPTPVAALAMVAIAFSPHLGALLRGAFGGLSQQQATLIVFGVGWTVFEVALIVSTAVLAGLINDVVPRGLLGRFYALFRTVSLVDGMLFSWFLLKLAETHFTLMFSLIATVYGVGFMLMCFNVREGQYPPPEVRPDDHRAGGFFAAVRIYFRECFSVPYYRWNFAAFTLGTITFLPVNTFQIFYAKQLNLDMAVYGKLIAAGYFTSIVMAYPLGWLVDRFHQLRMCMVALALYAVAMLYGSLFIHDARTFCIAFVGHTVVSGIYWTTSASLTQSLLPRAKFAQFASAGGMVTSLATMLVGPSLGLLMDFSGSNYRLTFVAGLAISLAGVTAMGLVYRQFMRRGGPAGYVAPGDVVLVAGAAPVPRGGH